MQTSTGYMQLSSSVPSFIGTCEGVGGGMGCVHVSAHLLAVVASLAKHGGLLDRHPALGCEVSRLAARDALLPLVRAVPNDVVHGAACVALRGFLAVAGNVPHGATVVARLSSSVRHWPASPAPAATESLPAPLSLSLSLSFPLALAAETAAAAAAATRGYDLFEALIKIL